LSIENKTSNKQDGLMVRVYA